MLLIIFSYFNLPLVGRSKNAEHFSGGGSVVKLDRDKIKRSRELRAAATNHERRLWYKLRELKRIGYHFRRQAPFQFYFLDFAEHQAKLVIELDGSQHGEVEQTRKDERRDAVLRNEGYLVLRFGNHELDEDFGAVIDTIEGYLRDRCPPPEARSALRPPHKGEV